MADGIYVALSGAISQSMALDVTSENLANSSTAGYRSRRAVFHEVLNKDLRRGGSLAYVAVTQSAVDPTPGAVRATGRSLDVVPPEGSFLAVQAGPGERYTRAGALTVGLDGTLKAASGDPVLSDGLRPITVPPGSDVTIAEDGMVRADGRDVARLRIVAFQRQAQMVPEGGMRFAAPPGEQPTVAKGPLAVGALEESNASPVRAMTELLTATRTFEAFQRAMDAFRDADRKAATTLPGT